MSADKRRKARIQGGWSNSSSSSNVKPAERPKPINSIGNACLGKTVDVPNHQQKFVYQEPPEAIRQKPDVRVIDKPGVFDLSTDENGVSRVRLFPQFIGKEECGWIYDSLFSDIPWRQQNNVHHGVSYVQPRLTAWFGDFPYEYSGVHHDSNDNWTPVLTMLKDRLEEVTGYKFNSLLANLYRDGHDSLDWHSDDEPSLRNQPTIASLSFGDSRNFELRKIPPEGKHGDYTYMPHVKIPLTTGSLLIMEGTTQERWQHRVPKEYHDRDARINLTFRVIYPD